MTVTVTDDRAVERRPDTRRRRRLGSALAALLVLVGGSAALVARHLDHRYGPIEQGSFGGVYSLRQFVTGTDGSSYRLASPPDARGELLASIRNRGPHPVTITSIDSERGVTDIRWSAYRFVPGGAVSGIATPWHRFPATVPGDGTIRLLITIQHPADCRDLAPGTMGRDYIGTHEVHWKSLVGSHTTTVDDGLTATGIGVC